MSSTTTTHGHDVGVLSSLIIIAQRDTRNIEYVMLVKENKFGAVTF